MKMISPIATKTLTAALCGGIALSGAACGSSEPGEGDETYFLTVVGDRNVYLENGERADLQVRYHDGDDNPIHDVVDFSIEGQAHGATLSSSSGTPDANGIVTATLEGSADDQAAFNVRATAPYADPVTFSVTIEHAPAPLDPNGVYQVNSTFDVVSGLEEGQVRNVVHGVMDFTEDPAGFLIDLLVENCDFGICDEIEDNAALLATVLNQALDQFAPELVGDLLEMGEHFGEIATGFGVVSELEIDGTGSILSADHSLTGVVIAYGNEQHAFTMSDMEVDNIEAYSVSADLTEDESTMTVGEHALPMSYGAMLRIAIEQVLIRAIDGDASDLATFLHNRIPCDDVGAFIEDNVGFLPAEVFGIEITGEFICTIAIDEGSRFLMDWILGLDDVGLEMVISGEGRPVDTNNDGYADVILDGIWQGNMEYAGSVSATLNGDDNEFSAERIAD